MVGAQALQCLTMTIRCAIYTRKSTEGGLEQEFNSPQAQREACEAFITSQRSLGWRPIAACYNDGGVSGGTLDRPALQHLLIDIANNKVDLVVVYKVDRLTRSLTDFAKLVERFDAQGISFVSVTQQFNTTSSMGRLTLNMLLSFAQFERDVTHKGIAYPGQHEPIIDRETFEAVRRQLLHNAADRRSMTNVKARSLLTGLVFDETGDRLCPTHANKPGRRYRYYISKRLMHKQADHVDGWRLPAPELERVVLNALRTFLLDERCVVDALTMEVASADMARASLARAQTLAAEVVSLTLSRRREVLFNLLQRIELSTESLGLMIDRKGLSRMVMSQGAANSETPSHPYEYLITVNLRRRGVEAKLVLDGPNGGARVPDAKLIELLARAHCWHEQLTRGPVRLVKQLAQDVGLDAADVGRTLQLAYLAPDIVEAILSGDQPVELTPRRLMRLGGLPLAWTDQRKALGFPAATRRFADLSGKCWLKFPATETLDHIGRDAATICVSGYRMLQTLSTISPDFRGSPWSKDWRPKKLAGAWWARQDSNLRQHRYERRVLTN